VTGHEVRDRMAANHMFMSRRPSFRGRVLGQNFLVDRNILGVIATAAELGPRDVVLEIGGGEGVLSSYLAQRVGHLHVVEIDRRLYQSLNQALSGFDNVNLYRADAVKVDFGALTPGVCKVVANLPYGVAQTVVVKSVLELADLSLLTCMVQREVAERLASSPGRKSYGVTSVLVQLACDVVSQRPIARTVFNPAPNVDSVLLVLRRNRNPASAQVAGLVHAAFSHRRKSLARSASLFAPHVAGLKQRISDALSELGYLPNTRAEALYPQDFVRLANTLEPEDLSALARL
jgi:16S rRNA (adenine1518-N6/adenine1519-N6)-dimethyltransferase